MNPSSRRSKTLAKVADSTHQQLNSYALAAGAAGVSVLALAQPSEAKIVYTPAHHVIAINHSYRLDLNHDGIPDFDLKNAFSTGSGAPGGALIVAPERSVNEVWLARHCGTGNRLCAAALPKGTKIGPKGPFRVGSYDVMAATDIHGYHAGYWFNTTAYLGLKFVIKGTIHFGWARAKVIVDRQTFMIAATVTRYAYETIPGKAIIAGATKGPDEAEPTALNTPTPEPATLGLLALGAPGMSIWRREESVAATPERD